MSIARDMGRNSERAWTAMVTEATTANAFA